MTNPRWQERFARWLLLLTLLHTVPVVWITPVAGGTAPAAALVALGLASLLTVDREGAAIALFALGPALVYCGIGWSLAWLLAKLLQRLRQPLRAGLLAVLTLVPLISVYAPIYIAGSHNASHSADLFDLVDGTVALEVLITYWLGLHALLVALYAGTLLGENHAVLRFVDRWRKPAVVAGTLLLIGALLHGTYPMLVCRPLAGLGSARAELCLARLGGPDQGYWYERAAEAGRVEAIAWMIEHTPDRDGKLHWLRQGAEQGDAAMQFALYERLMRFGSTDDRAESAKWLRLAAQGNHVPAQLVLVDELSRSIDRTQSSDYLADRNAWLERAAQLSSREAKLRLAQEYVDGSMGHPADLHRARAYYRELAEIDLATEYERMRGIDAAYYRTQIAQLDAWSAGLDREDPAVMRTLAERYLASQLPGPGVRERGLALLEQLAAAGDETARNALIVRLRTGTGGVDKDFDAAKTWLLDAAEAGDPRAMERVATNYLNGREGFPVDYPQARRWIAALIAMHAGSASDVAQAQTRRLRSQLAYIDKLEDQAGERLLGERELEQLGQASDAESHYRYAMQLLAGHGSAKRPEAIARLEEAAQQGHADAAWRLFQIRERGFPSEVDAAAALEQLQLAAANHHFEATRELALSYELGKRGLPVDLPRAIGLYESALAAGRDNRYGWNLDPDNYNHFAWLESRLRQARMKQSAQAER